MSVLRSSDERSQIAALKAHQKAVREHKSAKTRVNTLTEALADAQTDHRAAGTERSTTRSNLLSVLEDEW